MKKVERIEKFKQMKLGMFVHFGLYSIVGNGEWYMHNEKIPPTEYEKLTKEFKVNKNWAKNLVKVAKSFGAKYIVLTTRHHDGFSLYDTCGLTEYDAPHTPSAKDLIKEFVDECNKADISPFFYHTLIDWHDKNFLEEEYDKYFDYLKSSIKILCENYGKIGGFWFDGTWSNPNLNWHLDEIFSIIRKRQPQAIISNNGGLENPGELLNKEIDCLVHERGSLQTLSQNPSATNRAKEVCQTINDHWGICKKDNNYKSPTEIKEIFDTCQKYGANLLLNVGPKPNGMIKKKEISLLKKFGKLLKSKP